MRYSIKTLVDADRTHFSVFDGDIVLDAKYSLPRAVLTRLNLQPHYPEVSDDQFDDYLYGLKSAD